MLKDWWLWSRHWADFHSSPSDWNPAAWTEQLARSIGLQATRLARPANVPSSGMSPQRPRGTASAQVPTAVAQCSLQAPSDFEGSCARIQCAG